MFDIPFVLFVFIIILQVDIIQDTYYFNPLFPLVLLLSLLDPYPRYLISSSGLRSVLCTSASISETSTLL